MAPTKLGNAIAKQQSTTAVATSFQTAIAAARVLVPYTIPVVGLPCMLTIVGAEQLLALEARSNRKMEQLGYHDDALTQGKYELSKACHVLAEAVRDADPKLQPNPPPIGDAEDWGKLAPEILNAVWQRLGDLQSEYDPLADDVELTPTEFVVIRECIAQKKRAVLRSYGQPKLIAYMLIMDGLQSSSPTHKSEPGATSLEPTNGETSDRSPAVTAT